MAVSALGRLKKQAYTIALFPLLDNAAQIDVASKRGLKRKAFPLAHARGDLFQHQPPSLQCCRFWCKRRKSCRDQIGIDESLALRFFREKRTSESRLPRAVRTSDDDDLFAHASTGRWPSPTHRGVFAPLQQVQSELAQGHGDLQLARGHRA